MSEAIAINWMNETSRTAINYEFEAHMNLVSKRVKVLGIPGFESIGYDDWARQCKDEFDKRLILSVRYHGIKLHEATDTRIAFTTYEIVEARDGKVNAQGLEIILEKEDDDQWRVVQERVLSKDEITRDGLLD